MNKHQEIVNKQQNIDAMRERLLKEDNHVLRQKIRDAEEDVCWMLQGLE